MLEGALMLSYWVVTWVGFVCVGDADFLGLQVRPVPPAIRAAAVLIAPPPARKPICQSVPRVVLTSSRVDAMRLVKMAGPGAEPQLRWCQRLKCWEKRIEWPADLVVDGKKQP